MPRTSLTPKAGDRTPRLPISKLISSFRLDKEGWLFCNRIKPDGSPCMSSFPQLRGLRKHHSRALCRDLISNNDISVGVPSTLPPPAPIYNGASVSTHVLNLTPSCLVLQQAPTHPSTPDSSHEADIGQCEELTILADNLQSLELEELSELPAISTLSSLLDTDMPTPNYNFENTSLQENESLITELAPTLTSNVVAEDLDVATPNYNIVDTSPQAPLAVAPTVIQPQASYYYKGRQYNQAELDVYGNLTWVIVLFFFGVAEIGVLLHRIDRKAIAHCHPPICLFGYGNIPRMLSSLLRIITAGIGGADNDPRFPWSVEFFSFWRRCIVLGQLPTLADISRFVQSAQGYFDADKVHIYFSRLKFILLGLKASYKTGVQGNTAIHMDTILDYATSRWRELSSEFQQKAIEFGPTRWMQRVQELSPDILVMSVGPSALNCLPFDDWKELYVKYGEPNQKQKRKAHFVHWTTKLISGKKVLVVNALPNNFAFGNFSYEECVEIGEVISNKWKQVVQE